MRHLDREGHPFVLKEEQISLQAKDDALTTNMDHGFIHLFHKFRLRHTA